MDSAKSAHVFSKIGMRPHQVSLDHEVKPDMYVIRFPTVNFIFARSSEIVCDIKRTTYRVCTAYQSNPDPGIFEDDITPCQGANAQSGISVAQCERRGSQSLPLGHWEKGSWRNRFQ